MKKKDEDRIQQILRESLPAVDSQVEPSRDLWPAVLRRIDQEPAEPLRPMTRSIPLYDWALFAGLIVFAVAFPATIPVFLYYL